MSSEFAIRAEGTGKRFKLFARPADRLKQLLLSPLTRRNHFSEFWALRDISLNIRKGESFGIIGANGSGKSTFLQLVCGTMTPTTGKLQTCGRVVGLLELGSGFNSELSGRENVFVNAAVLGLTTAQIEERFDRIAAFADIGEFIDRPLKTYSTGMSLRLAFSVAAHVDADVLVIDEALAVGDGRFVQKCLRYLQEFRKRGTLLLVSHDLPSVAQLCDKAAWIDEGRVRLVGPAKGVCESYAGSQYAVSVHEPQSAAGGAAARIVRARIEGVDGRTMARVAGGERVRVVIEAEALKPIGAVVLGFYVKDRLGQVLFGETSRRPSVPETAAEPGQTLTASFDFSMPRLSAGTYSIDALVSDQALLGRSVFDWARDIAVFDSRASDVGVGLFGVAFENVRLSKSEKALDTFCIYPFKALTVSSAGNAKPCCMFTGTVTKEGRPMRVGEQSLDDIWNSDFMRDVRRGMIEGRQVPGCVRCDWETGLGVESARRKVTKSWESGWLNEAGQTPQELKTEASDMDFRLPESPEYIDLHLGSLCNLKCRMCSGEYSSAIAADRVQSQWIANDAQEEPRVQAAWFRRKELLYGELLRDPRRLRQLNLIGGEPFLIPEARELVRHLIETGAAETACLCFETNLTKVDDEWLRLLSRFKSLVLILSLDGFGPVNEYIRYPSRWEQAVTSLRRLRGLTGAVVYTNTTVQACNLFGIVDLIRYCDGIGLDFKYTLLSVPKHLGVFIMPAAVRREAARRLREYLPSAGARTKNDGVVLDLASALEAPNVEFDPGLLREFMIYTNDMDSSRGQDFAASFPELKQAILDAGFEWTSETRFAGRNSAAEPV